MTPQGPKPTPGRLADVPERVVVSCTATFHGNGVVRLPDRWDAEGPIAAFLAEGQDGARRLFQELDHDDRTIFVDVERKQAVDLLSTATECVELATLRSHKPNDATVRSLDVLVTHLLGLDLVGVTVAVLGVGNLGFKAALLLAERGARVLLHGRDAARARIQAEVITSVLPRHTVHEVRVWEGQHVDLLVTAAAAQGVVGASWVQQLCQDAVVVDAGIGNLTPDFVEHALGAGATVLRLDTRTTGSQLVGPAPEFFEVVFGRDEIRGVSIVSGGIIGARGTVVVDSYARPKRILGLADGSGGMLSEHSWTDEERRGWDVVTEHLQHHKASD